MVVDPGRYGNEELKNLGAELVERIKEMLSICDQAVAMAHRGKTTEARSATFALMGLGLAIEMAHRLAKARADFRPPDIAGPVFAVSRAKNSF